MERRGVVIRLRRESSDTTTVVETPTVVETLDEVAGTLRAASYEQLLARLIAEVRACRA
jgi:hypothetical protein